MSEESSPFVSVVLPTYNRADTLGRAIKSVLDQTYPDFELIVVDDGSTDHTGEIVSGFHSARIRYLHNPQRKGAAAARNLGIRESRGQWIAFQDSDDAWGSQKLAEQVIRAESASSKSGVVYCSFRWVGRERQGLTPSRLQMALGKTGLARRRLEGDLREALLHGNFISAQTALVKKECLDEIGGFDERLARLQDWDLWLRLASRYEFLFVDRPLVTVYHSHDSISAQDDALVDAFQWILGKYPQQSRARRLLSAQSNFAIGDLLLRRGYSTSGRLHLREAVRQSPLNLAHWFAASIAIFGPQAYRRAARLTGLGYDRAG